MLVTTLRYRDPASSDWHQGVVGIWCFDVLQRLVVAHVSRGNPGALTSIAVSRAREDGRRILSVVEDGSVFAIEPSREDDGIGRPRLRLVDAPENVQAAMRSMH
jgi:hypothetical protein